MTKVEKDMPCLAIIGIVAIVPLTPIVRGWVLKILWKWFVVPVFHQSQLSIAQAIGLVLIVGYLTRDAPHRDDRTLTETAVNAFVGPLLALTFGWIVSTAL